MKHAQARTGRTRGLRHRPRLHGHVGLLRRSRRRRGAAHDRARARARLQLPGHLGHVRAAHERAARRSRDHRPPRRGVPGDQVRHQDRAERPAATRSRSTAAPSTCARPARRSLRAPRRRAHRPLLPAPRRPEHADRGDGRRDGRARRGRQGAPPRALGGQRRDDPPRPRGAPDHRGAERVLAVDARRRGRDPAHARSSSGSRSSPTRRSAVASCRGASPRRRSSTRATSAATARASRARTCARTSSWPSA